MIWKIFLPIIFLMVVVLSFFAGMKWRERTLGELPKFKLKYPLEIQISSDDKGYIPSGVTLYQYRELPEINTYFVFLNIKEINIFEEFKGDDKFNLIDPLNAYPTFIKTQGNRVDR